MQKQGGKEGWRCTKKQIWIRKLQSASPRVQYHGTTLLILTFPQSLIIKTLFDLIQLSRNPLLTLRFSTTYLCTMSHLDTDHHAHTTIYSTGEKYKELSFLRDKKDHLRSQKREKLSAWCSIFLLRNLLACNARRQS